MKRTKQVRKIEYRLIILVIVLVIAAVRGFVQSDTPSNSDKETTVPATIATEAVSDSSEIPVYSGEPYVVINGNVPSFDQINPKMECHEQYGELDSLGRCTVATACIDKSLMPTKERGSISSVKPSGWQSVSYDFVDGNSLYNRCHLIGFQLTGENANEQNLITGTRYMNVDGMLPFENMVADYIKETGNRVLYRVTPVYQDDELVARGVQMEAWSVDDDGDGICFNVYCYNVQPGVEIDYATGESREAEFTCNHEPQKYVLNTSSGKFHTPDCSGAQNMSSENRSDFTGCSEELIAKGYKPCGSCVSVN